MCIAIYKPSNVTIDYDTLKRSYLANPDGCGMAYLSEDSIEIETTMDFEVFYEGYQAALEQYPDSPFLLHFRIATHGSVDEDNCHPFFIESHEEDLLRVFMHNGTITPLASRCDKNKGISDTVLFGLDILEHLPSNWETNPAIQKLIEYYIGWSKIVVMDEFGEVTIFNEHKGVWDNGIWYSNTTYKPKHVAKPVAKLSGYKNPLGFSKCDFCDAWADNCQDYLDSDGNVFHACYNCKWSLNQAGMILERLSNIKRAV